MNREEELKEWSKQRIQNLIKNDITKLFESILDYSEVAVGDEGRYKALRSKILRAGNDTIRNINSEVSRKYEVVFTGINEDIVKVSQGKGTRNDRK